MPVWPKSGRSIKKPALRRQFGNAARKPPVTMPVQCKIPMPMENLKTTDLVVAVRPERGYSATNYDASVANPKKTLRRQFGQKYDVKKVRNTLFGTIPKV